jgi:Na+/H+ antiporter NhaC
MKQIEKGNAWALLPILVFMAIYLVSSMIAGDFYKMPLSVSFLLAAMVALMMNRSRKFSDKLETFAKGMGNDNIMMMVAIFILAGAFAQVAREMGAVDETVGLGLKFLSGNELLAGVFLIACFIAISIGTSLGTIVAIAPMALGIAEKADLSVGLALGAVIGGAMFGDNLSMISDTTIAATRTQGCKMQDKFKVNLLIVLPAAIITAVIYTFQNIPPEALAGENPETSIWKVIPYLFVLLAAVAGMNVMLVLSLGTLFAGMIGLFSGSFGGWDYVHAMGTGIGNMSDIIIISILVGGIVEIIRENGGITFLLNFIAGKSRSRKGAEFGIAGLTSIINVFTANNTIAILMAGPIAKNIAHNFDIHPRRTASIMDTFSCFIQGLLPYGAQILAAIGIAGTTAVTPFEIMKHLYYPYLMGTSAILAIIFGFPNLKRQ